MALRWCALIAGLFFLGFGIAGFFPALIYPPPRHLYFQMGGVTSDYGYLFGAFPTNIVRSLLYVIIGCCGIGATVTYTSSKLFSQGLFFLCVLLVVLGILPDGLNRVWGFLPLFDWNVGVHLVTAVLMFYFGFVYPQEYQNRPLGIPENGG